MIEGEGFRDIGRKPERREDRGWRKKKLAKGIDIHID